MTASRISRRVLGLVVAWWALLLLMSLAAAQGYPTKPVRMIIGYPPGGPTDLTGRLAGQHLSEALGQQFVMDNRPGAGATVGATLLSRAEPDGYTLMLAANGEMAIAPNIRRKLPYDPLKDFAPVSRIGSSQLVLVVHPGVPAKSVAELVALAKQKPGGVNFASAGTGSTAHLAGELFKHLAAIDIVHVPYKGAGPALTDLMGGQVQMLITGYSAALAHIKAGKLRALGVTGAKRLAGATDLPTIGEAVKGYEVTSWYGILAPARTPRAIVERLHRELAAMTRKADMIERFTLLGIEAEGNSPQEFARQIRAEIEKWGRIVKIAKVPVE
ncbi:MAG: Bug family tripartite tricarboxylate transporter substrate binding protein [Burkholderiales bacterium]